MGTLNEGSATKAALDQQLNTLGSWLHGTDGCARRSWTYLSPLGIDVSLSSAPSPITKATPNPDLRLMSI
jgi:hypothetical protein